MFLNFFRNILRPSQMFPQMFLGLRGKEAKHLFCFPLVCSPWKHYEQQCFRKNVSSFAGDFTITSCDQNASNRNKKRFPTVRCYVGKH